MRSINIIECTKISGRTIDEDLKIAACGLAFFIGGTASAHVVRAIGPLATLIGTPAAAIGLAALCTPVFPIVGTLCGGFAGAVAGYHFSSSFASASGFIWGGTICAAATYYALHDF